MKKIIVLNHKTGLTLNKAKIYAKSINKYIKSNQKVIICPSYINIPYFTGKHNFELGAQNISYFQITGEITGKMLKEHNINYTIIGHNERKNKLHETNREINKKIKEAQKYNIIPIIVLGDLPHEKNPEEAISKKLNDYLKDTNKEIIIGYEPNYTFKDNQIPTKKHIEKMVTLIKNITKQKYNENIKVLYGGNINKNNIKDLEKIKILDGYLIGKTSLSINNIKQIFNNME